MCFADRGRWSFSLGDNEGKEMGMKMQQGGCWMSRRRQKEKYNEIEDVCSGSVSQFSASLHLPDVK